MTYIAGTPCWADLSCPDVDEARHFYAGVMGWQVPAGNPEFGGYTTASADGGSVAGIGPMHGAPVAAWTLYFASDDADATARAVTAAGGSILVPAGDVGDFGRMLIAADPTGAVFGVWQAKQMAGFDAPGTTGSFAWCDLRSSDPAAAHAFYGNVFGYHYAPVPMAGPDYATFALGDGATPLGGIGPMMGAPDGVPSHWLVYFAVADADFATARIVELGGAVHAQAFDTPFGRMVPSQDPFGAPFWCVQLP
jgi:hypothetical protein